MTKMSDKTPQDMTDGELIAELHSSDARAVLVNEINSRLVVAVAARQAYEQQYREMRDTIEHLQSVRRLDALNAAVSACGGSACGTAIKDMAEVFYQFLTRVPTQTDLHQRVVVIETQLGIFAARLANVEVELISATPTPTTSG